MTAPDRVGAYGLALPGLPGREWLNPAPAHWPEWTFAQEPETGPAPQNRFGPDLARVRLIPSGYAEVHRDARSTRLHYDAPITRPSWVHPMLHPTAVIANDWASRLVFHAGAFLDSHGRTWGVVGEREDGKSSAMMWLEANGFHVMADDLLVTDGVSVLAGPRCIDLREPAARRFAAGVELGTVGDRPRWRVTLPPGPDTAPFAGLIRLRWHGSIEVRRLPLEQRPEVVSRARAYLIRQDLPMAWLRVLAAPVLDFLRPQDWSRMDAAMTVLIDALPAG